MDKIYTTFVLCSFLLLHSFSVFCQEEPSSEVSASKFLSIKSGWSAGVGYGSSFFYGDIRSYKMMPWNNQIKSGSKSQFSLFAEKEVIGGVGLRATYHNGGVEGWRKIVVQDYFHKQTVTYDKHGNSEQSYYFDEGFKKMGVVKPQFSCEYKTADLTLTMNDEFLFGDRAYLEKLRFHLRAGVGIIYFRSYMWFKGAANQVLFPIGYETQRDVKRDGLIKDVLIDKEDAYKAVSVPIGVLLSYSFTSQFLLGIDFAFINTNSDLLDTVNDYGSTDKFLNCSIAITYKLD